MYSKSIALLANCLCLLCHPKYPSTEYFRSEPFLIKKNPNQTPPPKTQRPFVLFTYFAWPVIEISIFQEAAFHPQLFLPMEHHLYPEQIKSGRELRGQELSSSLGENHLHARTRLDVNQYKFCNKGDHFNRDLCYLAGRRFLVAWVMEIRWPSGFPLDMLQVSKSAIYLHILYLKN